VAVRRYDGPISSICDPRTPDEMKQMLVNCPDSAATSIGNCCPSHTSPDPATAPPSPVTTKRQHITTSVISRNACSMPSMPSTSRCYPASPQVSP
jgi:hypothetical protein